MGIEESQELVFGTDQRPKRHQPQKQQQKQESGGQKSLSSMQKRARSGSGDLMDVVTGQKGAGYWEPEPLILEILKLSQQKFQGAKKMTWKLLAMKSKKWLKKQGVDGDEKVIK